MNLPRHARTTYRMILPFLKATEKRGGEFDFLPLFRDLPSIRLTCLGWGNAYAGGTAWSLQNVGLDLPLVWFAVNHREQAIIPLLLKRHENELDNSCSVYDAERTVFSRILPEIVNTRELYRQDLFLWEWVSKWETKFGYSSYFPSRI